MFGWEVEWCDLGMWLKEESGHVPLEHNCATLTSGCFWSRARFLSMKMPIPMTLTRWLELCQDVDQALDLDEIDLMAISDAISESLKLKTNKSAVN